MDFLGKVITLKQRNYSCSHCKTLQKSEKKSYFFREIHFVHNHKILGYYKMSHYKHEYMRQKSLSTSCLTTYKHFTLAVR